MTTDNGPLAGPVVVGGLAGRNHSTQAKLDNVSYAVRDKGEREGAKRPTATDPKDLGEPIMTPYNLMHVTQSWRNPA